MTVFTYDGISDKATFLTENDGLIKCTVDFGDTGIILKDFEVGTVNDILSDQRVDEIVSEEVHSFMDNIIKNEYGNADSNMNKIFESFKARSEITKTRNSLHKKMERFGDKHEIITNESYDKLIEMKEKVISFIKENKEELSGYEDIVNSSKLSNLLGSAFDAPKTSIEELSEQKSLFVDYNTNKSVYELVCQQELISSELVESKENFSKTWINNQAMHKLASCLYNDDEAISVALEEAVREVPYLALASKSSIKDIFTMVYESTGSTDITKKEIKEFTSKVFEMKKPVKESVIKVLNDKHGINVQNLKFVPSFTNLAKAQSVFFEALSVMVGKGGPTLRDVLKEFSKCVNKKTGIQTLEVNDYIAEVLAEGGLFSETSLGSVNISEVIAEKANEVERNLGDDSDGDGIPDAEDSEDGMPEETEEESKEEETEEEEAPEEEETEEEATEPAGHSPKEMKKILGELDDLFKEVDWESLSADVDSEEEVDAETPEDKVEA